MVLHGQDAWRKHPVFYRGFRYRNRPFFYVSFALFSVYFAADALFTPHKQHHAPVAAPTHDH